MQNGLILNGLRQKIAKRALHLEGLLKEAYVKHAMLKRKAEQYDRFIEVKAQLNRLVHDGTLGDAYDVVEKLGELMDGTPDKDDSLVSEELATLHISEPGTTKIGHSQTNKNLLDNTFNRGLLDLTS